MVLWGVTFLRGKPSMKAGARKPWSENAAGVKLEDSFLIRGLLADRDMRTRTHDPTTIHQAMMYAFRTNNRLYVYKNESLIIYKQIHIEKVVTKTICNWTESYATS